MPWHERSSSEKRRGPSERSCTRSAVHLAPMISAVAATAHVVASWTGFIVRVAISRLYARLRGGRTRSPVPDDPLRLAQALADPARERREGERDRDSDHGPGGDDQGQEVVQIGRLRPDLLVERVDDRRRGEREDDHAPARLAPLPVQVFRRPELHHEVGDQHRQHSRRPRIEERVDGARAVDAEPDRDPEPEQHHDDERVRRRAGARGRVSETARDEAVAAEREEDARRAGRAAERARERGEHRAEVDRVLHPAADVLPREVAERRARAGERLDPGRVDAEAERLGEHHDRVEDAAEADGDRDRERDVPPRVVRLLAERRGALEPAEGEEPEDRGEGDSADRRSGRRHERLEREVLAVRRRVPDHLPEDDDDHDHDQRHGDPLEREQRARRDLHVAVGQEPDEGCRDEGDHDPGGAVPDARALEEPHAEEADLGDVGGDEAGVGGQQRPACEEPGARAERDSGERVRRAGMVEVARQPDERVRDERDRDRREEERERDRPPDVQRRGGAVEGHRRGRGHDPDRDRDRLPEAELAPERALAGVLLVCDGDVAHLSPPSKIDSGTKQPTTQFGTSTTSWIRRSQATLATAYASCGSSPWFSPSHPIVARTASRTHSSRSGPTPVQTWWPESTWSAGSPAGRSNCGASTVTSFRTLRRRTTSIAVSIAVPQTSPSPCAACVSPSENSAPSTPTGRKSVTPGFRCFVSMFPPKRDGGTIECAPGSSGATPSVPGNGRNGRLTRSEKRTRPLSASTREMRSHGSGYSSASSPKPGMIAVHPHSCGRSSRSSTASASP